MKRCRFDWHLLGWHVDRAIQLLLEVMSKQGEKGGELPGTFPIAELQPKLLQVGTVKKLA